MLLACNKSPPLKHRYSQDVIPKQKGQATHAHNYGVVAQLPRDGLAVEDMTTWELMQRLADSKHMGQTKKSIEFTSSL